MRTRIVAAISVVLLVTTSLVIHTASRAHARAVERSTAATLDARAATVASVATDSADLANLQQRLGPHTTSLSITTADGRQLGAPLPDPLDSADHRYRVILLEGSGDLDGATATLWMPADLVMADHDRLQRSLVLVGLAAVAASVLVTMLVTDAALRPVDRMLDELERSERKATEAEAYAVAAHTRIQAFLADAAHELKTPLAGIQAAAEALVHLPENAPGQEREELEFLLGREASRGGQLVSSLLEAAHVEVGGQVDPVPLAVMPLLQAERRRLRLAQPQLDVQIEGDHVTAMADRHGYVSVLRNLIENASTAAGPQGWVRIVCREVSGDGRPMVEVTVMDSGSGIPVDDRERVFDRLVRLPSTASSRRGSGLGLAIARGYARAMGGDVVHGSVAHGVELPGPVGAVFVARVPAA